MKSELARLAAYHAWAFDVLYAGLEKVSHVHYRADCGLFFASIHRTLNHLLLADRVWYGRLTAHPFRVAGLDSELESDRDALSAAIRAEAPHWQHWLARCDDRALAADVTYQNFSGAEFTDPVAMLLLHVFNHGTHHRGQISAAMTAFGYAAPEMDLIIYLRSGGR